MMNILRGLLYIAVPVGGLFGLIWITTQPWGVIIWGPLALAAIVWCLYEFGKKP